MGLDNNHVAFHRDKDVRIFNGQPMETKAQQHGAPILCMAGVPSVRGRATSSQGQADIFGTHPLAVSFRIVPQVRRVLFNINWHIDACTILCCARFQR